MVDITQQFRTCLLEVRNKHGPDSLDKDRILKGRGGPHAFSVRARDILSDIKKVDKFLKEEDLAGLSSQEIDQIENGAISIIRTTKLLTSKYKKDLETAPKMSSQVQSHFLGVSQVLERKLKDVESVFMKQKTNRVENLRIEREMSRLEDFIFPISTPPKAESGYKEEEEDNMSSELSPEELQLFQNENATMYEELQRTQNEVQSIESKVVKIAELQELFSEKVLQQKDDIELVSRNALAASENIKDGNEELRKAIQNKASIRVYILFSLLVLSFSLLFLDWYNP